MSFREIFSRKDTRKADRHRRDETSDRVGDVSFFTLSKWIVRPEEVHQSFVNSRIFVIPLDEP